MRKLTAAALLVAAFVLAPATPASAWENRTLCHHETWGGTYFCKYGTETETIKAGTTYFIVVNINYQVWTRWRSPGGVYSAWTGLGGQVWHGNPENDGIRDGNETDLYSHACTNGMLLVGVRGNGGDQYWRIRRLDGSWSPAWNNFKNSSPNCE